MLLVLEIVLTVTAWRRGWKAWALAPVLGCVALGMLIGFVSGINGGDVEGLMGMCLLLDLGCIVSLIVMAVKGHKSVTTTNAPIEQTETGLSAR
jgi:hypothetical protein